MKTIKKYLLKIKYIIKDWKGFYRQDNFNQKVEISNIMKVISYKEYIETIDSINNSVTNKEINSHYSNKHWNYIILCNTGSHNIDLISCIQDDDKIIIYGDEDPINLKTINKGYFIEFYCQKINFIQLKFQWEVNQIQLKKQTQKKQHIIKL